MKPVNKVEIFYNCIDKGNNKPPKPKNTINKLYTKPQKKGLKVHCLSGDELFPESFFHIKSQFNKCIHQHSNSNCSTHLNISHQQIKQILPPIKAKRHRKQKYSVDIKVKHSGLNLNPTMDTLEQNIDLYNKYSEVLSKDQKDERNTKTILIEQYKINCIENPKIPFDSTIDKFKMKKLFKSFGSITKISLTSQNLIQSNQQ